MMNVNHDLWDGSMRWFYVAATCQHLLPKWSSLILNFYYYFMMTLMMKNALRCPIIIFPFLFHFLNVTRYARSIDSNYPTTSSSMCNRRNVKDLNGNVHIIIWYGCHIFGIYYIKEPISPSLWPKFTIKSLSIRPK